MAMPISVPMASIQNPQAKLAEVKWSGNRPGNVVREPFRALRVLGIVVGEGLCIPRRGMAPFGALEEHKVAEVLRYLLEEVHLGMKPIFPDEWCMRWQGI